MRPATRAKSARVATPRSRLGTWRKKARRLLSPPISQAACSGRDGNRAGAGEDAPAAQDSGDSPHRAARSVGARDVARIDGGAFPPRGIVVRGRRIVPLRAALRRARRATGPHGEGPERVLRARHGEAGWRRAELLER